VCSEHKSFEEKNKHIRQAYNEISKLKNLKFILNQIIFIKNALILNYNLYIYYEIEQKIKKNN